MARGITFDLQVSRIVESGQLRVYVFSAGQFVVYTFDPQHDVNSANGGDIEAANVTDLVSSAIADIDGNLHGAYFSA